MEQKHQMNSQVKPRTVVFTDLDDTLIHTKAKLPPEAGSQLAATDRRGQPLSYFTTAQLSLLQLFAQAGASLIPVTGRNTDALNRVDYAFQDYRVVSHGAVILHEGDRICPYWLQEIDQELMEWPQLLEQSHQEIQEIIRTHQLDARSRVIIDQDIAAYVSIKGEPEALAVIRQHNPLDHHFYRHENGSNHALLPPYTRKKRAVEFIKQRMELGPDDLLIGLGDSLTDLPFMQSCHFSMMPSHCQIIRESLHHE